MSAELECPRCRQRASGTARRRGRCTACGAALVAVKSLREETVRAYLYSRSLAPRVTETSSQPTEPR